MDDDIDAILSDMAYPPDVGDDWRNWRVDYLELENDETAEEEVEKSWKKSWKWEEV